MIFDIRDGEVFGFPAPVVRERPRHSERAYRPLEVLSGSCGGLWKGAFLVGGGTIFKGLVWPLTSLILIKS
jgi:hypothetical protein